MSPWESSLSQARPLLGLQMGGPRGSGGACHEAQGCIVSSGPVTDPHGHLVRSRNVPPAAGGVGARGGRRRDPLPPRPDAHAFSLSLCPGWQGLFLQADPGSRAPARNPVTPKRCCVCVSVCLSQLVRLCATPLTVARQAALSMGFSRQERWSELPCPPPRHLPNPGIKPVSCIAGGFFTV